MTKINFRYGWYNDEKTVMHYIAENNWNWRDYHACIQVSSFAMMKHPHKVAMLIDFRESSRETMPRGLAAHMSSFGKPVSPALSGQVVVLGLPESDKPSLPRNEDGSMSTSYGSVYFASSEDEAKNLLAMLQQEV